MTPEEKAFLQEIARGSQALSALFLAIKQEAATAMAAGYNYSITLAQIARLADKGGLAALALAGNATDRIVSAELGQEAAEGYDLAALATAPITYPAREE